MITLANADSALKDYYLDVVNAQLDSDVSPFYNAIAKTSENVSGKDVKIAIAKGGMGGVRAGSESGDLPSPRSNRYYAVTLPLKNIYGTIEISDKAVRASADSSGAFVNLLNAEMEGLIADAKANFARMLYGDGNGYICRVVKKTSNTVLEVDAIKNYYVNCAIEIETSSATKTTTVTAVDKEAKTITVADSLADLTLTGGEQIYISDVVNKELIGLGGIFDDDWLYGYRKSAEPYFAPVVKTVAESALSENDLIDLIDGLEEESDGKVDMILCSHKTRRKIVSLLDAARRIVNTTDIAAGYSSVYVNDVPVYADKFCPDGRIYFVNTKDFVLNQLCDWTWLEDEGGRILKQVAGKAAYTATLVKYAELVCKKPCGQGLIKISS